LKRKELK